MTAAARSVGDWTDRQAVSNKKKKQKGRLQLRGIGVGQLGPHVHHVLVEYPLFQHIQHASVHESCWLFQSPRTTRARRDVQACGAVATPARQLVSQARHLSSSSRTAAPSTSMAKNKASERGRRQRAKLEKQMGLPARALRASSGGIGKQRRRRREEEKRGGDAGAKTLRNRRKNDRKANARAVRAGKSVAVVNYSKRVRCARRMFVARLVAPSRMLVNRTSARRGRRRPSLMYP